MDKPIKLYLLATPHSSASSLYGLYDALSAAGKASGDLPVADVSEQVGYEDTPFFRRLFKRETGLSPSEYRRMFGVKRFSRYT